MHLNFNMCIRVSAVLSHQLHSERSRLQSTDVSSSEAASSDSDAAAAPSQDGSVATIQLDMPRRSLQLTFRCNVCGEPSAIRHALFEVQCSGSFVKDL